MITKKDLEVGHMVQVEGMPKHLRRVTVSLRVLEVGHYDVDAGPRAREQLERMMLHKMWVRLYGDRPVINTYHEVRRRLLLAHSSGGVPSDPREVEEILKPLHDMLQVSFCEQ